MACDYPEGCTCGASYLNYLEQKVDRQWARGYFCAVACYLNENCADGVASTEAKSMFSQGGDWRKAAAEDIETFKKHGLIPHAA